MCTDDKSYARLHQRLVSALHKLTYSVKNVPTAGMWLCAIMTAACIRKQLATAIYFQGLGKCE